MLPSPCKAVLNALRVDTDDRPETDEFSIADFLLDVSEAPLPKVRCIAVFPDVVLNLSSLKELGSDPVLKRSARDEPELMLLNLPSRLKDPELYLSSLIEPLPEDNENLSSLVLAAGERPLSSRIELLPDEAL